MRDVRHRGGWCRGHDVEQLRLRHRDVEGGEVGRVDGHQLLLEGLERLERPTERGAMVVVWHSHIV